jgi:hypothetical protein
MTGRTRLPIRPARTAFDQPRLTGRSLLLNSRLQVRVLPGAPQTPSSATIPSLPCLQAGRRPRPQARQEQQRRHRKWANRQRQREEQARRQRERARTRRPPPHACSSRPGPFCGTCGGHRGPHTLHHDQAAHEAPAAATTGFTPRRPRPGSPRRPPLAAPRPNSSAPSTAWSRQLQPVTGRSSPPGARRPSRAAVVGAERIVTASRG